MIDIGGVPQIESRQTDARFNRIQSWSWLVAHKSHAGNAEVAFDTAVLSREKRKCLEFKI
jgi:hypothetical protein